MSIYKFGYADDVTYNCKAIIGQRVKVVKGRKYPIGSEHTIKGFTAWHDQFGHSTEYIITEDGLRINVENVRLIKPWVWHREIVEYIGVLETKCPNCGCDKLKWCYNYYSPSRDYYIDRYECTECGLDLDSY